MDIEKDLTMYFMEQVGIEVKADTLLVEENVIDSMGVMELIAYLETNYGIGLEMDDLVIENFESIKAIKNLIKLKEDKNES
ncbi:phosphopantetheine-binding protein [Thermodesulfobacteriota bacterium]